MSPLMSDGSPPRIDFSPSTLVKRRLASWGGLSAETVQATSKEPFDYTFRGDRHLLIATERAEREDGETLVEGLPISRLRNLSQKLTFVPAGREFRGWQRPRVLINVTYFYIDPRGPLLDPELLGQMELSPRLFFFDGDLWETIVKLRGQIAETGSLGYAEALSMVLAHELLRGSVTPAVTQSYSQGGLASWQQKRVSEFIEEHLTEQVPLAVLARIAQLSPFHFARAFKQSFGVPPHRYHMARRIARAKSLLAEPTRSVTEIAFTLGFSELSSFTAAFRKFDGLSPSQYRRRLA